MMCVPILLLSQNGQTRSKQISKLLIETDFETAFETAFEPALAGHKALQQCRVSLLGFPTATPVGMYVEEFVRFFLVGFVWYRENFSSSSINKSVV